MEALAQQLQDALGPTIAVYLGSEWLDRQPQLPFVIVVPGDASYEPPDGTRPGALASVMLDTAFVCKAALFEEAVLLAEACYGVIGTGKSARLRLGTEVWEGYYVRKATLTVTSPATLTRDDVTRVRALTFTQLAQFHPSTPEVPDDQTNRPTGETHFVESD